LPLWELPWALWPKPALRKRLEELSKAIQGNPRDALLLVSRGELYAQLGRYEEAARDYTAALAGSNSDTRRGWVYETAVRDEQVYSRLAGMLPRDRDLHLQRGRLLAIRGDWQGALREYEAVLECERLSVSLPETHSALSAYRAAQYEQAVECFVEGIARYPSQRSSLAFVLAMAYHRLGEHEKSRKAYDAGLEFLRSAVPPGSDDLGNAQMSEWLELNIGHREAKTVLGLTDEPAPKPERAAPSAAPPEKKAGGQRANK
jgi:tetratricopeptide (TPR) repeat protein